MSILKTLSARQVIFIGGKGGVGKTTCACALAYYLAQHSGKTLLISTDPAHSIGDAINQEIKAQATHVAYNLDAIEIDPELMLDQHFDKVEHTLSGYANPDMLPKLRQFLSLSKDAPGAQEAAMLEAICQSMQDALAQDYRHIVFDSAPTGHSLRLINLPEVMQAYTQSLLKQQQQQQQLREAAHSLGANLDMAQNSRLAAAQTALNARQQLFANARNIFHDHHKTAIVLVMIAEQLALAETTRAVAQLQQAAMPISAIFINQLLSPEQPNPFWQQRQARQAQILSQIKQNFNQLALLEIPLQAADIRGEALAHFFAPMQSSL